MTFVVLPRAPSSVERNPVSSTTVIHVGYGITLLKDIVSTGKTKVLKLWINKLTTIPHDFSALIQEPCLVSGWMVKMHPI